MTSSDHELHRLQRKAEASWDQGRYAEAIALYRQVLEIDPGLADGWYNLAWLLKTQGQFEDALEAYRQALARGVADPQEVHLNRAVIYADHLRRDAEAERELKSALTLAPDYAPALLNLGNLHEERGQREAAVECYEQLLAMSAASHGFDENVRYEALARMAHLQPPMAVEDQRLEEIRQAATAAGEPEQKANLWFALGRALNSLRAYDQAFAAFTEANLVVRRYSGGYDRAGAARTTTRLIREFAQPGNSATPEHGCHRPAPLFICGMFRSGSTLVEQILSVHPRIIAAGELDLLPRMVAGPLAPFPASIKTVSDEQLTRLSSEYLATLGQRFPASGQVAFISDKRPDNFRLIGLILRLFPSAKIIHTTRDPLDNGLSIFMQHLDPRVAPYAADLGDIGHCYGQYRQMMAHWKRIYPSNIHDFDYDAFVQDPWPQLQKLFAFLDLDPDPDSLEFHRAGGTVKTASYWQVRRPLYGEASGRWRQYRQHLGRLQRALGEAGVIVSE